MPHEFSHAWHSKFVKDGYGKMPLFIRKLILYYHSYTHLPDLVPTHS